MKIYPFGMMAILIGININCYSQTVDTAPLNKLSISGNLPYTDSSGNLLGCGGKLGCFTKAVIFYNFRIDKKKKEVIAHGRVIDHHIERDTIGEYNFIFLARIYHDTLQNIRVFEPTYSRTSDDSHEDRFPYRTGDFYLKFTFTEEDNLFFDNPASKPIMYKIGKLLSKKDTSNYKR
jgi:hypothetical protein